MNDASAELPLLPVREPRLLRWSLRRMLAALCLMGLLASHLMTSLRLHQSRAELSKLRSEFGYLEVTDPSHTAAARVPGDSPLFWQFRVYVPEHEKRRVAYSTRWLMDQPAPDWYSYVAVPSGESMVTARIGEDERDGLWKIMTSVRQDNSISRSSTVLPESQESTFRQHHMAVSSGRVGTETVQTTFDQPLKLLEDKWITDDSRLVLYGTRAPIADMVGVFLELQPDGIR